MTRQSDYDQLKEHENHEIEIASYGHHGANIECAYCGVVLKEATNEVDHEFIHDELDEKLREAFSQILERHSMDSGDIRPLRAREIDEAKQELRRLTVKWIESRI
jgi:transcription initiation factor TFIIIB Brf1 subunit/transcription initiation factor TFIIB